MTDRRKARKVNDAVKQIQGFQKRSGASGRRRIPWQLEIPAWQLAMEGAGAFAVAFVSGLGLGVLYQVVTSA
jgi:hypothetical protein